MGDDVTLSVAVVHGGKNARDFLNALKENGKHYDFIEVMACPGGCIGGGGQPRKQLKLKKLVSVVFTKLMRTTNGLLPTKTKKSKRCTKIS